MIVLLSLFIAACSSDEYTGDVVNTEKSISFTCSEGNSTRASETSLSQFANDFIVYGVKTKSGQAEKVFDNYVVEYGENTAYTTESNTNNWEYVGVRQNQTIKYWDYSANNYKYWAVANVDNSQTLFTKNKNIVTSASFDLTESNNLSNNGRVYFSKQKTVEQSSYAQPVVLEFLAAASRIRFGFYETIPGYEVIGLQFYGVETNGDFSTTSPQNNLVASSSFANAGTYQVDYTSETSNWVGDGPTETNSSKTFGALNLAETTPMGEMSSNPTYAGSASSDTPGYYTYILPYPGNSTPLTIKCKFTLKSLDTDQRLEVGNAMATVPAEYCQWKPNHSYTYLFKLTDNKLKPITFVAYGDNDNTIDNQQGTITTVGDYSITTYQEGSTDDAGIDYKTGKDMEVTVVKNMGDDNAPVLEQVELDGDDDYVVIYHQLTNKEWVVETECPTGTDPCAGRYKETIEGGGTTNGYENNKAHFTPDVTGTYRVEYWHKEGTGEPVKLAVKIVKIHGEDTEIEEYEKWQSGVSGNTTW